MNLFVLLFLIVILQFLYFFLAFFRCVRENKIMFSLGIGHGGGILLILSLLSVVYPLFRLLIYRLSPLKHKCYFLLFLLFRLLFFSFFRYSFRCFFFNRSFLSLFHDLIVLSFISFSFFALISFLLHSSFSFSPVFILF